MPGRRHGIAADAMGWGGGRATAPARDRPRPRPLSPRSKLAFFPPTPPTYTIVGAPGRLSLKPAHASVPSAPDATLALLPTPHGSTIVAAYIPPPFAAPGGGGAGQRVTRTIMLSHGNALDVGQQLPFCRALAAALNVGVASYDYSGYGASTGQPGAANAVRDAAAALGWLTGPLGLPLSSIVLYGQSIGSGPTAALAASPAGRGVGGVVLHSPLASGLRVLRPAWAWWPPWLDIFPVAAHAKKIRAPLLVLHGAADAVVPVACGRDVHAAAAAPAAPLFLDGVGHDGIEAAPEYLPRLKAFLGELDAAARGARADAAAKEREGWRGRGA